MSSEQGKARQGVSLRFLDVHKSQRQRRSIVEMVYGCCVAAVLFLGISAFLYHIAVPDAFWLTGMVAGLLLSMVLNLCWHIRIARLLVILILIIWTAGFIWFFFFQITDGFKLVANALGSQIGSSTGRIQDLYQVKTAPEHHATIVTLFLIPLSLLLSVYCAYCSRRQLSAINVTVTMALFLLALILSSYPPLWVMLTLVFAQVLLFAGHFSARKDYRGAHTAAHVLSQAVVGAAAAVILIVLAGVLSPGYQVSSAVEQARAGVVRAVDDTRYGVDQTRGMPDGNLNGLGELNLAEEPALEVTMEQPESLWLRGFIGSEYTGTEWRQTESPLLFRSSDLFYWLHRDGFYGQTQLGDIASQLDSDTTGDTFAVSIKNVGASSRNIYTPYEVQWAQNELLASNGIGDSHLYSEGFFGNREYGYLTFANQVKRYPALVAQLNKASEEDPVAISSYLVDESHYANFVSEHYLAISEDMKTFLDESFESSLDGIEDKTYTSYKQAIIAYLTERVAYEKNPLSPSLFSDDFALDVLSVTKEGYSVHFASAATLMFRYCGIPARYVEGYLITPQDISGSEGSVTLTLDGTHAHAWTEIYIDGIGWVPIEVTPPYFGLMEEPDSYEGVSSESKEAPQENTQENEEEDTSGETPLPSFSDPLDLLWLWVLLVLVAVLFIFFVAWGLIRRQRIMAARQALLNSSDNTVAIIAMYWFVIEIFHARGVPKDTIMLIDSLRRALSQLETDYAHTFDSVFSLYEKAAYSGTVPGDEERAWLDDYTSTLLSETRQKSTFPMTLKNRLQVCLY